MGDRNEFRLNQGEDVLANDEFLLLIMVGSGRGGEVGKVDLVDSNLGDLRLILWGFGDIFSGSVIKGC